MVDTSRQLTLAVEKIEESGLDLASLISAADTLTADGTADLALVLYKFWLLSNPTHPLRHIASFNCGCILLQSGRYKASAGFLTRSAEASPDFHPARLNLASAHERNGDNAAAMAELQQVLDRLGTINSMNIGYKLQALRNIGRIAPRAALSEAALRQAVEIDPTQAELLQHWVNRRQGRCVWPAIEKIGNLSALEVIQRLAPLSMAAYIDDPLLQLAGAKRYSRQLEHRQVPNCVLGEWPRPTSSARDKLRIAYLSSDFSNHAVGYLMSDVFEHHARSRYEISVFNIGQRTNDSLQQKIMGQVDRWFDISGMPDRAAAALIVREGADILLDMNGHTNHQRTGLLALRPAPIIANWLGYPGTMGSHYHNYILADDFLVPPGYEPYYSERVLRLPCYQPNGHLYDVPATRETRADLGLPEKGVVFCCFNGSVKITEPVFDRWMYILASVPGSVLWLRGKSDDEFATQLRAEAVRRGVAPERLIFLSFRANTEYLGCHRYADIFLDSFPYGAHTTASDALRMGVPIVTLSGLSFASRVCGSLSRAAGLPELVCETPEQYIARAIELGNDPQQLAQTKARLAASLPGCVLFDSKLLVEHLERFFEQMWTEYCSGELCQPRISGIDMESCVPMVGRGKFVDFIPRAAYLSQSQGY